jgi:hypothetical protein
VQSFQSQKNASNLKIKNKIRNRGEKMNRKLFYTLGALVLMLSMVLAACAPAATEAPAKNRQLKNL